MGDKGLAIWRWVARVSSGLEDDNLKTAGEVRVGLIDSVGPFLYERQAHAGLSLWSGVDVADYPSI